MEFHKLISEKLSPLFEEYGFKLTGKSNYTVNYKAGNLVIEIVHNPRENSNTLWFGRDGFQEVEIDNQVMKEFFKSDLKLSNLPQETFVNNVFLFFVGDGIGLLSGNESDVISLEKFNKKRSDEFTENLINKKFLDAANKAWKEGNYFDVVRHLQKVNEESLTTSLKQKYKIAQKRLSN
ncbi:hypothetical protein [Pseudozobellia sp. WGM2]|uniref:hypothetical protein n=1 Tax=Pseudozobellia sp. WGM2 TaxID=2787625 RepID=UPI001ADF5571|nr:hypothetical protein [Pseudozobellia sp. WGM2]